MNALSLVEGETSSAMANLFSLAPTTCVSVVGLYHIPVFVGTGVTIISSAFIIGMYHSMLSIRHQP